MPIAKLHMFQDPRHEAPEVPLEFCVGALRCSQGSIKEEFVDAPWVKILEAFVFSFFCMCLYVCVCVHFGSVLVVDMSIL